MENFKIDALSKKKQVWNKAGPIVLFFGLFASVPILVTGGLSYVSLFFPSIFGLLYLVLFLSHNGSEAVSYENGVLNIFKYGKHFQFEEKNFTVQKYTIKSVEYGVKVCSEKSYVFLEYSDFAKKDMVVFGRINRLGNKIQESDNFYGGGIPEDEIDRKKYIRY